MTYLDLKLWTCGYTEVSQSFPAIPQQKIECYEKEHSDSFVEHVFLDCKT